EQAAPAAAITLRPGHPDPPARAEPPAERRRPMTAKIAVRHPQPGRKLAGYELAHFAPQRLACGRQFDGIEAECCTHRLATIKGRGRAHNPRLSTCGYCIESGFGRG